MPPKSTGKAPVKSIAPTDSQSKKMRRRRNSGAATGLQFRSAIKKCLKKVVPDDANFKATEKATCVMCGISEALLCDILQCAAELAQKNYKETIVPEDVTAALQLLLTGDIRDNVIRDVRSYISKAMAKGSRK